MWMLSDSYARGVHHLFMIPQLLVAFAFPPAGMVLYLLITRPLLSTRRGTKGLPRTNWKKE